VSDRKGKDLERLIATLERVLNGSGAEIESPSRRLRDQDTGAIREHDVLITWDHGHHQILTAIECRDRSRPVGVNDVEAFADKCSRTGVHSGAIVSSKGFRDSAKRKAASRSITCMALSEVESFDWMPPEPIVQFERQFGAVNSVIMFDGEAPADIARIFDTDGNEISTETLAKIAVSRFQSPDPPDGNVGKLIPVKIKLETVNWTVEDSNGRVWPVDHVIAETTYTTARTAHPVKAHSYEGGGKKYEVASAEVQLGEHTGRFVLLKDADGSISVSWAPERR
jgi:hypothetical protein